jgi:hypothetical protein
VAGVFAKSCINSVTFNGHECLPWALFQIGDG